MINYREASLRYPRSITFTFITNTLQKIMIIGTIIGDIVGSRFEWLNIKSKEFPFREKSCQYTDDTVMTLAIAEALIYGS